MVVNQKYIVENTKKCLKYLERNGKITIFAPDNLVLVYKTIYNNCVLVYIYYMQ